MDFSSLVLMERDSETKYFVKELGSYEVGDGAEYITKLYCVNNVVNIYFSTLRDVEEWEFTAVYDEFNEEVFAGRGFEITSIDDEYNPTWLVKFDYNEEYQVIYNAINTICTLVKDEMERVFDKIKDKEDQYK